MRRNCRKVALGGRTEDQAIGVSNEIAERMSAAPAQAALNRQSIAQERQIQHAGQEYLHLTRTTSHFQAALEWS